MSRVPTCPILASGGAALKDAARRQRGGLKAVLDRGSADRRRDFRPGRRNGPVQPNEETSLAAMPPFLHTLTDTTLAADTPWLRALESPGFGSVVSRSGNREEKFAT